MGRTLIELNFKDLNIIKHSLQKYIARNDGTPSEKLEELKTLEVIMESLNKLY